MKLLLTTVGLMVLLTGCQQSTNAPVQDVLPEVTIDPNQFYIDGKLDFEESVTMVYLMDHENVVMDSSTVSNNSFSLNGSVAHPTPYFISFKNRKDAYPIILENTSFDILINENQYMVLGGDLNSTLTKYRNDQLAYNERKVGFLNLSNFKKDQKKLLDSIALVNAEQSASTLQFIFENESNLLSQQILVENDFPLSDLKTLKDQIAYSTNESLLNALVASIDVKQKIEDEAIANRKKAVAKKEEYRAPAPMFTGESLTGSDLALATVLQGKKVVLVDFWASWCKPCRMITPQVRQIYDQYKDKGFEIITVSEDRSRIAWKNGIEEDQMMQWEHIYDNQMQIASSFGVRSIPHMVLIDEKGRIINNKISLSQLRKELKKVFN